MKRKELVWWSSAFELASLAAAFLMSVSIVPPIDGGGSRYPLTIIFGVAAVLLVTLSVASFAAHVIWGRR